MSPAPSAPAPTQLPEAVRQALQRGNLFDAIKLMRQSGVTNLGELRAVLEAEARRATAGKPPGAAKGTTASTTASGDAARSTRRPPARPARPVAPVPEAQHLPRPATIEDLTPRDGLSPGEVPRSSELPWWLLIIAVIAGGLLMHLWRRGGDV
ncbi:hypothetical protein [Aquabacterium sp.]|uniref:hypothetical protein n=1 Tax=Aquabacterium sp. TaxID=1872578 RepID=UPI0037833149